MYAPGEVRVEDRPDPKIFEPTDAIIRLFATCICGSDLWPYRGVEALALVAAPEVPSADLVSDYLAASDVLGTGWFAAVAAEAAPGKTVAVVGDGAVGEGSRDRGASGEDPFAVDAHSGRRR